MEQTLERLVHRRCFGKGLKMKPEFLVVDQDGNVIASLSDGEKVYMPGTGDVVREWVEKGVPSLRGSGKDVIAEIPCKIPFKDKGWGLAVLEECERLGWGLYSVHMKQEDSDK